MSYISAQQAAAKWGISKRRVQILCAEQRIPNATRIGYMWVVPEDADKPVDERRGSCTQSSKPPKNPMKSARNALKALSTAAFQIAKSEILSALDAKKNVMAIFAVELIVHFSNGNREALTPRVFPLFGISNQLSDKVAARIKAAFLEFLCEHSDCTDDALSWAYQFINKQSKDSGLEATQFFTEKYMISALVDSSGIERSSGKILDPACGGGNFLLYALERLCDTVETATEKSLPDYLQAQFKRLYGYEIDDVLAVIASINLRIKALSILKKNGYTVSSEDFFRYNPHIYCSVAANIEGALDVMSDAHQVVQVGGDEKKSLRTVFDLSEFIFTNPPFQTVKGMDQRLKGFLKAQYPNAKCDMCNAFIEFVLMIVEDGGICGLVTQNSWMYLDSFEPLRKGLLEQYTIQSVIELGSNAFYDISGEKANVALLLARKSHPGPDTAITCYSLRHLSQPEKERILFCSDASLKAYATMLKQYAVLQSPGVRFGMQNTSGIQVLQTRCSAYGAYAVPMQGTSTGDAKSMVGYFWEHIGDSDWRPVSKGGSYSRWLGLNNYSVKWGAEGEYIKAVSGSAIRNAKYFSETQLVFSDTGTAGLNVRLLQDGQIFIASGPGIRITSGNCYAHLAFLNSRFSAYFIRMLSPKLTIAAGYIAQIPTLADLLSSKVLSVKAKACVEAKQSRLSRRPINLEFMSPTDPGQQTTLEEQAKQWYLNDLADEWRQLCLEYEIDHAVLVAFDLSYSDRENIDRQVGIHAMDVPESEELAFPSSTLDWEISELLDSNCMLCRTRPDKNHLGCDGILEFLAHKHSISPKQLYTAIANHVTEFPKTLAKYRNAYLHVLVLSALGYSPFSMPTLPQTAEQVTERVVTLYPCHRDEKDEVRTWIRTSLTTVHASAFFKTPIIQYSSARDTVQLARRP